MENPNDWTSEKDVSCMYSLSQQDTSRDNRLNMLVESRVRREVQARFGGEFLETYRRNTARHRVLSLRLTAQYLVLFVAGLLGVFVCFAGMYMSGVPQGFCILFALAAGLAVTGGTFYLSRRFGSYGLQKLMASRRHPRRIIHRRAIRRLLRIRNPRIDEFPSPRSREVYPALWTLALPTLPFCRKP